MRFNDTTIEEINREMANDKQYYDINLKIGFGGDDIVQFSGSSGWHICKISELTDMIKSLEHIRTKIEEVTGVKC